MNIHENSTEFLSLAHKSQFAPRVRVRRGKHLREVSRRLRTPVVHSESCINLSHCILVRICIARKVERKRAVEFFVRLNFLSRSKMLIQSCLAKRECERTNVWASERANGRTSRRLFFPDGGRIFHFRLAELVTRESIVWDTVTNGRDIALSVREVLTYI